MKHKVRKAVWQNPQDPSQRGIVTQETREYSGEEETTEKIIKMGEDLSKKMPKHSIGHKDLGWLFIKASSVERSKTFDIETAAITHLKTDSFDAAIAIVEQLRTKIYIDFGKEQPATRQDLKDTMA